MATESDLRDRFRDEGPEQSAPAAIDLEAVLRRARRRRMPRQLAVVGAGALAAVGLAIPAVSIGTGLIGTSSTVSERSTDSGAAEEPSELSRPEDAGTDAASGGDSSERAPDWKLNPCSGPLSEPGPTPSGLVATVAFPAAASGAPEIAGTVTLTNTGPDPVVGTTSARPAITVSQDGVVLWHSSGPVDLAAVAVELAPGQSTTLPAVASPVRCTAADEGLESLPADLPALPAGTYEVSAAFDVLVVESDGGTAVELVSAPPVPLALG